MNPFRTFLFFLLVLGCIFVLSLSVPQSDWTIAGNVVVKVPDLEKPIVTAWHQIFQPPHDHLITTGPLQMTDSVPDVFKTGDGHEPGFKDTTTRSNGHGHHLIFPDGDTTLWHSLFARMQQARYIEGGIRILYYGDSQIEGDRITAFLRKKLQEQFGGSGPGLISPKMVVDYTKSVRISSSPNWRRFTMRDFRDAIIASNRFGILLNFCTFTAPYDPSTGEEMESASVKVLPAHLGYPNAESYRRCRILADRLTDSLHLEILTPYHRISDHIPGQDGMVMLNYAFDRPQSQVEFRFYALRSPRIFAMALDDMTGLAVDNIPLRGSQGLDFSKTDTAFFKQMVHTLNVGMIILHFGVNVAMNVVDDYSYYETAFYRELNLLKKLSDAPILVVGISDMMVDGGAMEMPNLEKIRAAQIRASGKAGCVFYDLYTAMGGRGSMKDWVASDPPLARSDYIHFSNEGANLVAQKMYEAIMAEYDLFELNQ